MNEDEWLSENEVVLYHRACVQKTGEPEGIRDKNLLESALAKPKNLSAYEKPSVYDLAACYAEGIARNHPFLQGNKRTAFAAALAFLDKNGVELEVEKATEMTEMVEGLAQGIVSREAFADHLRENSHELQHVEQLSPETEQQQSNSPTTETPTLSPDEQRQAELDAMRAEMDALDHDDRDPGHEWDR